MEKIETERLIVRNLMETDADDLFETLSDERQAVSRHIALKNGFVYEREDDGCSVYRLKM